MTLLKAAQHLPPLLRVPAARLLCRWQGRVSVLDPLAFTGQRVLILGPARTVNDDLATITPQDFDVIVRMNNGLDTPVPMPGVDPLRCDVLFHSLTQDTRPVTPDKLHRAQVRILVHRTPTKTALLRTLIACEGFGPCCPQLRYLPRDLYTALGVALDGASPTTGLLCAQFFLAAPVRQVAVMGFSFFQTRYVPGYDDLVGSDPQAVARIATKAHHDPAREAALFARLAKQAQARGVTVTLGPNVIAAMQSHATG